MDIWKQIKNLSNKEEDEEYDRKMQVASDSTIMSLKKLKEIQSIKVPHNGNG